MNWLKELLRKQGIEESKLDGLVAKLGKELPKHMVPKQRYNALNEARKMTIRTLGERDQQLEKLQASIAADRESTERIDKLRRDHKRMKEKYKSEIRELRLLTALLLALGGQTKEDAFYERREECS